MIADSKGQATCDAEDPHLDTQRITLLQMEATEQANMDQDYNAGEGKVSFSPGTVSWGSLSTK